MSECFVCKKKYKWWDSYGSILNWRTYCKYHWYEKLRNDALDDVNHFNMDLKQMDNSQRDK